MEALAASILLIASAPAPASAPATASASAGPLAEARRIAAAAGLLDAPCPFADGSGIPAYFHYREDGAASVADSAVLVPGSVNGTARWLTRIEEVPAWAFLAEDGSPNLGAVSLGERGIARARVGRETWEGRLTRFDAGASSGVLIDMLGGGRIKEASLELSALPTERCPDASIVTVRVRWKLGLLARLFAGDLRTAPALFALRLRDDIVARALCDPAVLSKASRLIIERDAQERLIIKKETGAPVPNGPGPPASGDRVLRALPAFVRLAEDRQGGIASAMEKTRGGTSVDPGEFLGTFLSALDGRHELQGVRLLLERRGERFSYFPGTPPRALRYWLSIVFSENGSSLSLDCDIGS